jgi:hypothetical protein
MPSRLCAMMALLVFAPAQSPTTRTPQQAVDELLPDRAFAAANGSHSRLTPMFASRRDHAYPGSSRSESDRGLKAVPTTHRSAQWVPIRGGISGDRQHGFTFGYDLHKTGRTAEIHDVLGQRRKRMACGGLQARATARRPGGHDVDVAVVAGDARRAYCGQ